MDSAVCEDLRLGIAGSGYDVVQGMTAQSNCAAQAGGQMLRFVVSFQ